MNEDRYELPDFDAILMAIARADDVVTNELSALKAERDALYKQHIAVLDERIQRMEQEPVVLREALRETTQTYIVITGDLTVHDLITVARVPRLMYDKDAALEWCEENDADCVRIKKSLDVRKFEKLHADDYPGAERVNNIEIRIPSKLGHLLIEAETSAE